MKKILEKLNKLSLPMVILIASIILGGFYYVSQVSKYRSNERQQVLKIKQDCNEKYPYIGIKMSENYIKCISITK